MAKELPYFKFEPSEWEAGNIQAVSREAKGLFIEICSLYWIRLGELPYALALQKLCNGDASQMQVLCDPEIIGINQGQIIIEFLDEQLDEFQKTSEKRANAANKRWSNASALQVHSKSNAIREEDIRVEEIKVDKKKKEDIAELILYPSFNDFWELYQKPITKGKCETKWKKIKQADRELIMQSLPDYIHSTPDKQYRKNPLTYLNNESWNDEIITNGKESNTGFTKEFISSPFFKAL